MRASDYESISVCDCSPDKSRVTASLVRSLSSSLARSRLMPSHPFLLQTIYIHLPLGSSSTYSCLNSSLLRARFNCPNTGYQSFTSLSSRYPSFFFYLFFFLFLHCLYLRKYIFQICYFFFLYNETYNQNDKSLTGRGKMHTNIYIYNFNQIRTQGSLATE